MVAAESIAGKSPAHPMQRTGRGRSPLLYPTPGASSHIGRGVSKPGSVSAPQSRGSRGGNEGIIDGEKESEQARCVRFVRLEGRFSAIRCGLHDERQETSRLSAQAPVEFCAAAKSSSVSFRIHADIPFVMLVPINGSMLRANTSHVVRAATARRGILHQTQRIARRTTPPILLYTARFRRFPARRP